MFTILQIIISVVVIYLIFSVIVYVIVEWISGFFQLRGKMLKKAVLSLFKDRYPDPHLDLGKMLYHHPRVESLRAPNDKPPSYIPAPSISSALIDIIGSRSSSLQTKENDRMKNAYENYIAGVNSLQESDLKTLLSTLGQQTKDIETLHASIEKWFNDCMDRVSGWYKRKMKRVIFSVAAIITLGFNVDTIHIIRTAKADPVLRQHLNDLGDILLADSVFTEGVNSLHDPDIDYYDDYVNDSSVQVYDSAMQETADHSGPAGSPSMFDQSSRFEQLQYMKKLVRESDLPIGWGIKKDVSWPFVVMGWMLTVLALSAGAPFWFDILKKLVNIRETGPKPSNK